MKDVLNYFGIEIPEQKKGEKLKPKKAPSPIKVSSPQGPDAAKPKKPKDGEHDEDSTVDRAGQGESQSSAPKESTSTKDTKSEKAKTDGKKENGKETKEEL